VRDMAGEIIWAFHHNTMEKYRKTEGVRIKKELRSRYQKIYVFFCFVSKILILHCDITVAKHCSILNVDHRVKK
jgi:hypothetical protein